MKVAYLLGSLNRGGTETLLLDVCRHLKNQEIEALGVYRKKGILESDFLQSGIPFEYLPVGKNIFSYLFRLRKMLLSNNISVVHAQQPLDALLARLATLFSSVAVVLTLHGFDFSPEKRKRVWLKLILRSTHANVYVSKYQRDYYVDRYKLQPGRQWVVYNGIDASKIDVPDGKPFLRSELKAEPDTLLLGMVGNFNEVRDQFTVCRFLHLLNREGVDFRFVFAGKRIDSMSERYDRCVEYCKQNGLSDKVTFSGVRNDVPKLLHELDAFIYSTEHDTFGIAVAEAMMAGIPVFVNDWEVMREITDNGNLAVLYKTGEENDLLAKFLLYLQDKQNFRAKAEETAVAMKKRYSVRQHIDGLLVVYKKIKNGN